MTDLEQQLTDHLRRRAAAATPRYDLDGVEQASDLVTLVDLDHHRRRPRTRRIIGVAAAVALVVGLAALAITSRTEPSVDETTAPSDTAELRFGDEVIVFEPQGAGGGWDLAAQHPETGEVRTLVSTDGIVDCADAAPCRSLVRAAEWSADGRWVAFTVSPTNLDGGAIGPCVETIGLWVKSAVGDPRQLTTPCDAQPSRRQSDIHFEELWTWSPTGARLAYARADGETSELFVIDPSDGSTTSLGTVAGHLNDLDWSPDGTRIAYSDGRAVYQVEVDGGERSLLSDTFDLIIEIAWSPDGARILVHDQSRYRIQVMDADGSDLHALLVGQDACCATAWSPAGDRILYVVTVSPGGPSSPDFYTEVWTISPDGSNPIKVFDASSCEGADMRRRDVHPVWAPSGTQIGYYACGEWVVANADGTGEAQPIGGLAPEDIDVPLLHRSWAGGGLTERDLALIGQIDH
jgi:hypothetical protein